MISVFAKRKSRRYRHTTLEDGRLSENLNSYLTYEGQDYRIAEPSYDDVIKLPDGRILKPGAWLESHPMQPTDLKVITEAEAGEGRVLEAVAVDEKWQE